MRKQIGILVSLWMAVAVVPACAADKPADPDQEFLRQAGVATDDAGLLAYLRKFAERDDDLANLDQLVRQLGDPKQARRDEASRKLAALGLVALPALRKATKDRDQEVSRRARAGIEEICRKKEWALIGAAIRRLVTSAPAGTAAALMDVLPFVVVSSSQVTIWFGVDALAARDAKTRAVLENALADRLPVRRAIAACLLGHRGNISQKRICERLLGDPDAPVRLRAAQGLLAGGDKRAIPPLIALLDEAPLSIAWQSEELLRWVAATDAPKRYVGLGTPEDRRSVQTEWKKWWTNIADQIDLAKLSEDHRRPGLFLLAGEDDGKQGTWIVGCDGRPHCYFADPKSLIDAQAHAGYQFPPCDTEKGNLKAQPGSSLPTLNGYRCKLELPTKNFLGVSQKDSARVVEIDPKGRLLWDCTSPASRIYFIDNFLSMVRLGFTQPRPVGIDLESPLYLSKFLRSKDPELARWGAARLLDVGSNAALAAPALVDALGYSDENTTDLAAQTLQKIGTKATSLLIKSLSDVRPSARARAAEILGTSCFNQERRVILPPLVRLSRDPDPAVRVAVVKSLSSFSDEAEKVIPVLAEALEDKDSQVVERAAESLGVIGSKAISVVPALLRLLKDKNPSVRPAALTALGRIGPLAKEAVPELVRFLQDDGYRDCHYEVICALGKMRDASASAVPLLVKCLSSKKLLLRSAAVVALGRIGPKAKLAVPGLIVALQDKAHPELEEDAAEALGRIGPAASVAVPALQQVAKGSGPGADAAARALRKINAR